MDGYVKSMHLSMTQDLMKISGKKPKSKLPPKPKYVIDTSQIKQIIKGHGTEAFKNQKDSSGLSRRRKNAFLLLDPQLWRARRLLILNAKVRRKSTNGLIIWRLS
jgi:hypothetical protein